jgi:hypothetical protein
VGQTANREEDMVGTIMTWRESNVLRVGVKPIPLAVFWLRFFGQAYRSIIEQLLHGSLSIVDIEEKNSRSDISSHRLG